MDTWPTSVVSIVVLAGWLIEVVILAALAAFPALPLLTGV